MTTIALDAMGGDNAPQAEVEGAIQAAKHHQVRVILVGREERIKQELAKHEGWQSLPLEIRHASEVITMEDSAAKAMRAKKDSSIRIASRLVRDGEADGVVSAGNTGAAMATAKMVQGMIPGVERPALASAFPTATPDRYVVVIDVGANVDSSAKMLSQFAVMGEVYSRVIFRVAKPRIGLLSIGEEEHKGNELTHETTRLLKAMPKLNFIGNVEGRDLYTDRADVIVCDGFVGNVALKVSEGVAEVIRHMLRDSLQATITRKIGAMLARSAFAEFRKRIDYSEFGGAPLLGVKGVCIISHGRSNAKAIKNAIRMAKDFAEGQTTQTIEAELRSQTSNH
jgi:glycerol-3-phosphate acyltransferase PlsX